MSTFGFAVLAYLASGLIFALVFSVKGCRVIDPDAAGTGVLFRVMIIPGATLLWPYLLRRWISGRPS